MTDWTDEIAAANAVTRNEVRQLIDRGLSGQEIVASLGPIFEVDFGEAEPVDPMVEFAKAMLALAEREHVTNVNLPATVVNVPKAQPIINVTSPEINLPETSVTVAAPPPAQVTVNVPKSEPVVNVKATLPNEISITKMPDRVTRRQVNRDKKGLIAETLDVETDA